MKPEMLESQSRALKTRIIA